MPDFFENIANLKQSRIEKGLSTEMLAAMLGVSSTAVRAWETWSYPSRTHYDMLAMIFDWDAPYVSRKERNKIFCH